MNTGAAVAKIGGVIGIPIVAYLSGPHGLVALGILVGTGVSLRADSQSGSGLARNRRGKKTVTGKSRALAKEGCFQGSRRD